MPWVTSKIWHWQGVQFNFLLYKTNWGPYLIESGVHRPARILEKGSGLHSEWRTNMCQVDCSQMRGNLSVGMNQINRGKRNPMPSIPLWATWAKSLNMKEGVNSLMLGGEEEPKDLQAGPQWRDCLGVCNEWFTREFQLFTADPSVKYSSPRALLGVQWDLFQSSQAKQWLFCFIRGEVKK